MLHEHAEHVVLSERPERIGIRELAREREEHRRIDEGDGIVPDDQVLRDAAPRRENDAGAGGRSRHCHRSIPS